MDLLEQATDCLRLKSGQTWVDEEGNPVEDNEEWQDEVDESGKEEHGTQSLDIIARAELARRRVKLRAGATRFYAEESMRRITRPIRQAGVDREINPARASAFPEHRFLEEASPEMEGPLQIWNSRNVPRICFVDHRGKVRRARNLQ